MATNKGYSEREMYEMYDEWLCDVHGETVNICGLSYPTSNAFKDVDPIGYHCGFVDWLSAMGYDDDPTGKFDYIKTEEQEQEEEWNDWGESDFDVDPDMGAK